VVIDALDGHHRPVPREGDQVVGLVSDLEIEQLAIELPELARIAAVERDRAEGMA